MVEGIFKNVSAYVLTRALGVRCVMHVKRFGATDIKAAFCSSKSTQLPVVHVVHHRWSILPRKQFSFWSAHSSYIVACRS